jgi:WD40 repeat protein
MAHFLSEATHQRLELRDVPDDTGDEEHAYSTGIVKTHVFQSAMRAITVVDNCQSDDTHGLGRYSGDATTPFASTMRKSLHHGALDTRIVDPAVDAMPRLQVWSGDTVGTVTARLGLTGAPQHILAHPRERGIYAFSLHHHEPHVWVGFSDGFLHIFNAKTGDRVCEMRAHTAAINCIVTVGNYVFTAGSDWQIIQWDPVELKRVPHGQFSGHQNAVRCLAGSAADSSASGVLYSGGDDYVVRCWDLDTGYERADPWPIIGHTGAVRAIAVHGVYLFSASSDGQVKAWNTQTAQLVRTLDDRGAGISVGSLAIDAASPAVWAGGTDGTIRMWNAQTLVLIGERTDHHATHVAMITTVARASAVKAWVLDSTGTLTTVFSDPDGACSTTGHGGYSALQPIEQELQRQVDTNRVKILHNYRELERCRDEFDALQSEERAKKGKLAAAMARNRARLLAVTFGEQSTMFMAKRGFTAMADKHATVAAAAAATAVLRRYMNAWVRFAQRAADASQQRRVMTYVSEQRERALLTRYVRHLAEHHSLAKKANLRLVSARAFSQQQASLLMRAYFWRWERIRQARVLLRQRAPFTRAALKLNSAALLAAYWTKLRNAVVANRASVALNRTLQTLQQDAPLRALRTAFNKWSCYKNHKDDIATKQSAVAVLNTMAHRDTAQAYLYQWMLRVKERRAEQTKDQLARDQAQLADMQRLVKLSENVNEAALEQALAAKQQELAQLRQEEQVWDVRLRRRADFKRHLQREALRCPAIDSSEPLPAQLQEAVYLLKARGVNVKHNEEDILFARQAVPESSTAAVFAEGLSMVRKICASAIRPAPLTEPGYLCWFVGPLFSVVTEKQVLKASQGLSRMVTAYDMSNVKQLGSQWTTKLPTGEEQWLMPQFAEAIENLGTLLELATRAHRIRRGEDMRSGGPKPERRVRSTSRSRSRSKSQSRSKSAPKKRSKSGKAGKKAADATEDTAAAVTAEPAPTAMTAAETESATPAPTEDPTTSTAQPQADEAPASPQPPATDEAPAAAPTAAPEHVPAAAAQADAEPTEW